MPSTKRKLFYPAILVSSACLCLWFIRPFSGSNDGIAASNAVGSEVHSPVTPGSDLEWLGDLKPNARRRALQSLRPLRTTVAASLTVAPVLDGIEHYLKWISEPDEPERCLSRVRLSLEEFLKMDPALLSSFGIAQSEFIGQIDNSIARPYAERRALYAVFDYWVGREGFVEWQAGAARQLTDALVYGCEGASNPYGYEKLEAAAIGLPKVVALTERAWLLGETLVPLMAGIVEQRSSLEDAEERDLRSARWQNKRAGEVSRLIGVLCRGDVDQTTAVVEQLALAGVEPARLLSISSRASARGHIDDWRSLFVKFTSDASTDLQWVGLQLLRTWAEQSRAGNEANILGLIGRRAFWHSEKKIVLSAMVSFR